MEAVTMVQPEVLDSRPERSLGRRSVLATGAGLGVLSGVLSFGALSHTHDAAPARPPRPVATATATVTVHGLAPEGCPVRVHDAVTGEELCFVTADRAAEWRSGPVR